MVPSQGSVQTTAGRGNIHTRRPVHAESPRNTHATFHTRPQNGYANQINGYYHQNMVTAVNDPSLYHRHHVHSQNPEDVAKEGWIIAEDDEGALTPPTSQTHHSAGYIGVNADAHAFHQYRNAVNSHRQPIPVVNVNHENYDDDGIPPEGIPIYDDEDDERVEVEEDDYYGGQVSQDICPSVLKFLLTDSTRILVRMTLSAANACRGPRRVPALCSTLVRFCSDPQDSRLYLRPLQHHLVPFIFPLSRENIWQHVHRSLSRYISETFPCPIIGSYWSTPQ